MSECFIKIKNKMLNNHFVIWLFMSCATFTCFILSCLIFFLVNKNCSLRIGNAFLYIFTLIILCLSVLKNKVVPLILYVFIIIVFGEVGYAKIIKDEKNKTITYIE